jgi:hypothetical protein
MHMFRSGNVKNTYNRHIYTIESSISKAELHRLPKFEKENVCVYVCIHAHIQSQCQIVEVLGGLANYGYETIM